VTAITAGTRDFGKKSATSRVEWSPDEQEIKMKLPTEQQKQVADGRKRPLSDAELDQVNGGYQSGGSNGSPVVHDTFSLNFAKIKYG
jgi:hypothetical protein